MIDFVKHTFFRIQIPKVSQEKPEYTRMPTSAPTSNVLMYTSYERIIECNHAGVSPLKMAHLVDETNEIYIFFSFLPRTRHTHICCCSAARVLSLTQIVQSLKESLEHEISKKLKNNLSQLAFLSPFPLALHHHTLMMHQHLLVHLSSKQDNSR